MNLVATAIPLLATSVALSLPAVAQEKSLPERQVEERSEIRVADGCLTLRMPGIAEPSEQYNAYVIEHCPINSLSAVEASSAIRDAGIAYGKFLEGHP